QDGQLTVALVDQPRGLGSTVGVAEVGVAGELLLTSATAGGLSIYDGGGECALGPPDSTFELLASVAEVNSSCPGCGAVCRATPRHTPEAELRFRARGAAGWPAGAARILPAIGELAPAEMAPVAVLAEGALLRFRGGAGLQELLQLRRGALVCLVGLHEVVGELARDDEWPLICRPPPLWDVEGLQVRVQLAIRHEVVGLEFVGGPFSLQVLDTPRATELVPRAAPVGARVPVAVELRHAPLVNLTLLCDFGPLGTVPAQLHGGKTAHCLAPEAQATAVVPLDLIAVLVVPSPLLMQRVRVPVSTAFAFEAPARLPFFAAESPESAPCGVRSVLRWRSAGEAFQALATAPYRCAWSRTELGDVTTSAVAFSPFGASCRVPASTRPRAVSVRLEDPTGRTVAEIPVFKYFAPLRGTWVLPDGRLTAESVVRFETNGAQFPSVVYGLPRPGVSVRCRLGALTYEPDEVDVDGVDCSVPAVTSGEYSLSLVQGGHVLSPVLVQVDGDSAVLEEAVAPRPSELPLALRALRPAAGLVSGGTAVVALLESPWPAVPLGVLCHFGSHVVQASLVAPGEVHCLSPLVAAPGVVDFHLTVGGSRPAADAPAALPFEFFEQAVAAVRPAAGGVEVALSRGVVRGPARCRVGAHMRRGERLDHRTIRCPLADSEVGRLRRAGGRAARVLRPRGGLNAAIVGAAIALRSTETPRWYLHVNGSGQLRAQRLYDASALFRAVAGGGSRVALYSALLGGYACPEPCPLDEAALGLPNGSEPPPPEEALLELADLGGREVLVFSPEVGQYAHLQEGTDDPFSWSREGNSRFRVEVRGETPATLALPTEVTELADDRVPQAVVQIALNDQDFGSPAAVEHATPPVLVGSQVSLDGRRLLFRAGGATDGALCVVGPMVFSQVQPLPTDAGWERACDIGAALLDSASLASLPPLGLVRSSLPSPLVPVALPASPAAALQLRSTSPAQGPRSGATKVTSSARVPEFFPEPQRFWCNFGPTAPPVAAERAMGGTLFERLVNQTVSLRSVAQRLYVHIRDNATVTAERSGEEEDRKFAVLDGGGGTVAFFNALHQRFLQVSGRNHGSAHSKISQLQDLAAVQLQVIPLRVSPPAHSGALPMRADG
ncbi:unnamed protein product, partial [Prorocentrum cordatum]